MLLMLHEVIVDNVACDIWPYIGLYESYLCLVWFTSNFLKLFHV